MGSRALHRRDASTPCSNAPATPTSSSWPPPSPTIVPPPRNQQKLKRGEERFTLELEPTPDILAELGRAKANASWSASPPKPNNVAENARGKLARKGADMIVANDVTQEGAGFDTDTNIVTLFLRDGREIPLPQLQ